MQGEHHEADFDSRRSGIPPDHSLTAYKTDRGSWVVQGWVVTGPEALATIDLPAGARPPGGSPIRQDIGVPAEAPELVAVVLDAVLTAAPARPTGRA